MKIFIRQRLLFAAIIVGTILVGSAGPCAAQSESCQFTISSLPGLQTSGLKISGPGTYCLLTDVYMDASFTGAAIEIKGTDVVLDLNGHKISGKSAGVASLAIGIRAIRKGVRNITIKNGTVQGFYEGIYLAGGGHVIEGIRVDRNTRVGIEVAGGPGSIVRNNQILNTGGAMIVSPPGLGAQGIIVNGANGTRVLDNDIDNLKGGDGSGEGIVVIGFEVLVQGNRITRADVGVRFKDASTGKYRDNLTSGVTMPFVGGFAIDAGGNN